MKKLYGCLVLSVLLSMAPFATAGDIAKAAIEAGIDASFSEVERQLIEKYLGGSVVYDSGGQTQTKKSKGKKNKGMPPGLAKRDKLPPGLERQLQKNGTLPPGLAKKSLPSDLDRQLRPVPAGYERRIIEDAAIVLVHKATGKIADVVIDIVTGD